MWLPLFWWHLQMCWQFHSHPLPSAKTTTKFSSFEHRQQWIQVQWWELPALILRREQKPQSVWPLLNSSSNIVFHDQNVAELAICGGIGKSTAFFFPSSSAPILKSRKTLWSLTITLYLRGFRDFSVCLESRKHVLTSKSYHSWCDNKMWRQPIFHSGFVRDGSIRAQCCYIWSNDQRKQGQMGRMCSCSASGMSHWYIQLDLYRRCFDRECCVYLVGAIARKKITQSTKCMNRERNGLKEKETVLLRRQ